jgi:hypothetical protein
MASLVGAISIADATDGFSLARRTRSALFQVAPTQEWVALAACPPVSSLAPREENTGGQTATRLSSLKSSATRTIEGECEASLDEECESDDSIVQWMTRRRLADGGEVIEGAVRIELDAAEKIGVAHLAFVPPLSRDPQAKCHLLCDFDGRVRITVAKSYGLRIEARQSGELSLATTINVAFSAEVPPAATRAAAA